VFWADEICQGLSGKQVINDSKTPSGRVHVGALRGVILHDVLFRVIAERKLPCDFYYGIDDYDPMDSLPTYLPPDIFGRFMGEPLCNIPSPDGKAANYAEFYASEYVSVFNSLGAYPQLYRTSELYRSGQMNRAIELVLREAEKVVEIYRRVSGIKREPGWMAVQIICEKCGKVGTTKVVSFDGKEVEYLCEEHLVTWAKGCGYHGKTSPFDGRGKLPWVLEWVARWEVLGVTLEGCGKDHFSAGGARDRSAAISREVFGYPPPLNVPYEHLLVGGKKMSSSKGIGASAAEMAEIMPPELLRFLMTRPKPLTAIDFDPGGETIPRLFDEYDRYAKMFFEEGEDEIARRVFQLTQVNQPQNVYRANFSLLATLQQLPNVNIMIEVEKQKGAALTPQDREETERRLKYARMWLKTLAPDKVKFEIKSELPGITATLKDEQRLFLARVATELKKREWSGEDLQTRIYELSKEMGLSSSDAFGAIYLSLLAKPSGPKAGWLIATAEKEFVIRRFEEAAGTTM